ncbi:VOC family protein [Lactococcus lactis]|uniref:VOC family protein n=1 Tax=Lactococcus lactis TaxID=1358 RepID=UPI00288CEE1F|nr:VOC family protein [Lactococcus lactis]MDT2910815.1 VOC family protein [Lactococcus lactis]
MLDHIDITVKDLNRSKEFYRPLLSALGINGFSSDVNGVKFYDKKDYIWIGQGIPKRFHFAFSAQDKKQVDDFYNLAIKIGGKSIGEPKSQNDNYYSCYILDLDGYLLEAVYRNKD